MTTMDIVGLDCKLVMKGWDCDFDVLGIRGSVVVGDRITDP
jgi:hypothetical protein